MTNSATKALLLIAIATLCGLQSIAQTGVSINSTGNAPNSNAILDLDDNSGTKGLLVPRMTDIERGNAGSPHPANSSGFTASLSSADKGMTIFNLTSSRYEYWDGNSWETLLPASVSGNTLDGAYDEGGNGAGRLITADGGAVEIQGPDGLLVNGNVGIGLNSPSEKLQIDGNILFSRGLAKEIYVESAIVNGEDGTDLTIRAGNASSTGNSPGDGGNLILIAGDQREQSLNNAIGSNVEIRAGNNTSSGGMGTDEGEIRFLTNNTERMQIEASGQIGIGTSAPTEALDIDGLIRVRPFNTAGYVANSATGVLSSTPSIPYSDISGAPSSLPPGGPAGGDLSGSYPNPDVVDDSHNHTEIEAKPAYSWTASTAPSSYPDAVAASFVQASDGFPSYGSVLHVRTYNNDGGTMQIYAPYNVANGGSSLRYRLGVYNNAGWTGWRTIWDDNNDGASSGMDADLLDGQNGSYYLDNTDSQTLSIGSTEYNLSISGGNTVQLRHLRVVDTRSVDDAPTAFDNEVAFDFKNRSTVGVPGSGTYSGMMTIAPWGDNSGNASHQLNFNEGGLFWRQGQPNASSWGAWDRIMTESNVNTYVNGDNLGNHSATTTLDMNNNTISDINQLDFNSGESIQDGDNLRFLSNSGYMDFRPNDGEHGLIIRQYDGGGTAWGGIRTLTDGTMQLRAEGGDYNQLVVDDNGNVGVNVTDPTQQLDVNGGVRIRGGGPADGYVLTSTDANGNSTWTDPAKSAVEYSGTVTAGNWYRIAQNNSGGKRAAADFTLRCNISGGGHSTLMFSAGIAYNNEGNAAFTMRHHSWYNNPTFTKIRIVDGGTYDSQYLEVYCSRTGSVRYSIGNNLSQDAWIPVSWTAGSIPGGYSAREYDVDKSFVVGDSDDRFTIAKGGNVGIGVSNPTYKLQVAGLFKSDGITETSDFRLKKNIQTIESALDKVSKMNGVTYNWKVDEFPENNFTTEQQYGLIAQELEKVIPELVQTDPDGWKSIEYTHLVPVLVEAIKELQSNLGSQIKENADLKALLSSMDKRLIDLETQSNTVNR